MLVAVGVVTQIVQGVVIYKQGQTISELRSQNANLSTEFHTRLEQIEREKNEQIDRLTEERNIDKAEKQKLIKSNQELARASQEATRESQEATRVSKELARTNQELSKKNEEVTRASQDMVAKLDAILSLPGMQIALQNWQEAGDMYRSNLSEPHSEPSTIKSSEEESCTDTASVAESEESDIEIIDHMPPSTSMNGLTLSRSASNQR